MSINFSAVMDHSLPWDQLVMLDRALNEEWRREDSPLRAACLWQAAKDCREPWSWLPATTASSAGEELSDKGCFNLTSETGFGGMVYRRGISISHAAKWWSFLVEDPIQTALRAAVLRIAFLVGARTVIYLPDSTYKCSAADDQLWHGKGLPDVLAWLEQTCGPPAANIGDIYRETEKGWEGDGYYVALRNGDNPH